ncbi:hypothetical protein N7486_000693 [Penicillium sp. IBT 16267x]|nr:hypothetical protein N7486_000693 [Penicillium sp. IBT 16267x]
MADSQCRPPDLWLTIETTEDGCAELRPIACPVDRRQNDTESLLVTKDSSGSVSPLSELNEEVFVANMTSLLPSPALKPESKADVIMRDVIDDTAILAQDDLKEKRAARASSTTPMPSLRSMMPSSTMM